MSVSVLGKVKRSSRARGSAYLVELVLADEVRDGACPDWWPDNLDFPVCWLGKTKLAAFSRLTERTADRAVEALVEGGQLRIVRHQDIHLTVLSVIGKSGTSNLYILCTGQTPSTLERVEAYLRGGQFDPRQIDGVNGAAGGGKRRQNGGVRFTPETLNTETHEDTPRAHARAEEPTEPPHEHPLIELEPWMADGAPARWRYGGREHQGVLELDGDGTLRFRSRTLPYTQPAAEKLLGHLEPITEAARE